MTSKISPHMKNVHVLTTARKGVNTTLHIINWGICAHPYVVCWNFTGESWDHGTYCATLGEASQIYWKKCLEFDFEIQE